MATTAPPLTVSCAVGAQVPGGDAMGFIYTWMRLSSLKLLDWYRNGNYQPKDMGHVQKTLVEMLANVARSAEDPLVRVKLNLSLPVDDQSPPLNYFN